MIAALKVDPIPYKVYDVSKLHGFNDAYRVRIGDIRLVYRVDSDQKLIDVTYVGPRGRAYRVS